MKSGSSISQSAYEVFLLLAAVVLFQATDIAQVNRQLTQEMTKASDKRTALVIGNGAYTAAPPLKNPTNDARDMAATLKALGFDVTSGIDVDQRTFKQLIREFGQKLKAGGSGLFYYAGHGVQSRGRNYLIPVDANIASEAEVEDSSVDVGLLLNFMDDAQNGLNIVILDACRNNPFARSFRSAASGLAQVDAPTGTLIAYATAPGTVASDGIDRNGLYTAELLQQIRVPGQSVTDMFMNVRAEVVKKTGKKQVPWESSSLIGSFYFNGRRQSVAVAPADSAPSASGDRTQPVTAGTIRKNSIGMELVYIAPGSFMMGSSEVDVNKAFQMARETSKSIRLDSFDNEKPLHRVTIKDGFWIGKFEVTHSQWQAVMGGNPSTFTDCIANCPVENVSWEDVQTFLKALNQKNDGFEYDLPGEAEWEYAARGGTASPFAGTGNADELAWHVKNSSGKTHPVGTKQPNGFGLYDMHGNVLEWCRDIYAPNYNNLGSDQSANVTVGDFSTRVLRGGSWFAFPYSARSAHRIKASPSYRDHTIGFRVAARLK